METRVAASHALSLVLVDNIDKKDSCINLETTLIEWIKIASSDAIFEERDGSFLGIGFLIGCVLHKFGNSWTDVITPGLLEDAFLTLSNGIDEERSSHLDSRCMALSEATRFCFSIVQFESKSVLSAFEKLLKLCKSTTSIKVRHSMKFDKISNKQE